MRRIPDATAIKYRGSLHPNSGAERTRLAAAASADGLRAIAAAVSEPGGKEAITQRLAEAYIKEIPAIAKQARMIVVPDKPNDVAGVVATAMAIAGEVPQLSGK